MKIILNKNKLIKYTSTEKNLGFVPTMGALHPGHISLIKKCNDYCNKTVVSIFINKPQFNNKGDFQNYPRILKKDIYLLKKLKVDYLYLPTHKQIYPNGPNKKIKLNKFSKMLCGKFRPGHFESVIDVIGRFIKIIKPGKIFFGNKDMQQLMLVKNFVRNNHNKTKVIGCKTIREKNGIPYSSRNFLLTTKQKRTASIITKLLLKKKQKLIKNKDYFILLKKKIYELGVHKIDYIKILDINKIFQPFKKRKKYKIFIAYYLNKVRLIDNI